MKDKILRKWETFGGVNWRALCKFELPTKFIAAAAPKQK
jgi:hypothetical protein